MYLWNEFRGVDFILFVLERCLWKDLRRLQINGEFSHCQADDNLGQAKYLCKVTSADTQNGIKRSKRARCSCADSRNRNRLGYFLLRLGKLLTHMRIDVSNTILSQSILLVF